MGSKIKMENKIDIINKIERDKLGRFIKNKPSWNKNTKGLMNPWHKGKKNVYSEEAIQKMRMAKLGKPSKRKSRIIKDCIICNHPFECRPSEINHVCCSKECRSISRSNNLKENNPGFKKGNIPWCAGGHSVSGEEHYNWKGGITSLNHSLRCKAKWKIWRELVFIRDNFICQNKGCNFCHNLQGVYLHPHHIKKVSKFSELAFDINNGITYCKAFHLNSGLHREKCRLGE